MDIKNWQPLTMLTVDYKILTKLLASHLKIVLPDIISEHQTGFMEKRQISLTIRTSLDVYKSRRINGYLLSLDFEKCFDKIEYESILGSLCYFNMGESFIQWNRLLMQNFESCTVNNGSTSNYFPVTRSCHQGCPIAPYYYLCCGQVLSDKIQENQNIQGVSIVDLKLLIAQFADDTQLFLKNEKAVKEAVSALTDIEANMGLMVNYAKISIHCLGKALVFDCKYPIVWDPGGLEILGIPIDIEPESQYENLLSKADNVLRAWSKHKLTLVGKVIIVNTLITPLFVYSMQVLPSPSKNFFEKFDKLILQFLWGSKKSKIPLKILYNAKTEGGLGLVNLRWKNESLKAVWVMRDDNFTK